MPLPTSLNLFFLNTFLVPIHWVWHGWEFHACRQQCPSLHFKTRSLFPAAHLRSKISIYLSRICLVNKRRASRARVFEQCPIFCSVTWEVFWWNGSSFFAQGVVGTRGKRSTVLCCATRNQTCAGPIVKLPFVSYFEAGFRSYFFMRGLVILGISCRL